MVQEKDGKTFALILALIVLLLAMMPLDDALYGVSTVSLPAKRLTYHFFHANIFHALLNVWMFLNVVFFYRVTPKRIMTAFIFTTTVPQFCLTRTPTVGLSAVVWFLYGSVAFNTTRPLRFLATLTFLATAGFLFPNVNAAIHLYATIAGTAIGLWNYPFIKRK